MSFDSNLKKFNSKLRTGCQFGISDKLLDQINDMIIKKGPCVTRHTAEIIENLMNCEYDLDDNFYQMLENLIVDCFKNQSTKHQTPFDSNLKKFNSELRNNDRYEIPDPLIDHINNMIIEKPSDVTTRTADIIENLMNHEYDLDDQFCQMVGNLIGDCFGNQSNNSK